MADNFYGHVTLHVRKGGDDRINLEELGLDVPERQEAEVKALLAEGGRLTITEHQASYGNPLGHDWPYTGHIPGLPDDVDYDHHNDAKHEYDPMNAYRRGGKVTARLATQNCELLLSAQDVERILRKARTLRRNPMRAFVRLLRQSFRAPPVTYEVGDRIVELDLDG